MYTSKRFAVMTGLPVYGERANIENVNIDDVITYRVAQFRLGSDERPEGLWIFSKVIGTTPTMIKVFDLFCENTEDGVNLYINYEQNCTTKCLLKPTRRIFKVKNVVRD